MTLVERVARAICIADEAMRGYAVDPSHKFVSHHDGVTHELWEDYIPAARAAISALEEPSEAMKVAGSEAKDGYDTERDRAMADYIYRAMIRAALEEKA